jgi:hypothetical protein
LLLFAVSFCLKRRTLFVIQELLTTLDSDHASPDVLPDSSLTDNKARGWLQKGKSKTDSLVVTSIAGTRSGSKWESMSFPFDYCMLHE